MRVSLGVIFARVRGSREMKRREIGRGCGKSLEVGENKGRQQQ